VEELLALEEQIDREISERRQEPSAEELFEAGLREQREGHARPARVVSAKRASANSAGRTRILLGVLAASLVVYAGFLVLTREEAPPPKLKLEQFRHLEAVQSVTARPPSLFVKIGQPSWSGLTAEERRQLIDELGRIAGEAGYAGVQVQTVDGATVGQWLRKTGTRLSPDPDVAT
jgi:hypothetical protein